MPGPVAGLRRDAKIGGFGIYLDFRNPIRWEQDTADLYRENIDLAKLAESLGFASVWVSEHHFSDDGYAPSPFLLAVALAQATKSMRIGTAVAVLPLYHPIRFAEDVAVLDIIAGGRLELGVGAGWRPEEFAAFGADLADRGRTMDRMLGQALQWWAGKEVSPRSEVGDSGLIDGLAISPRPVQQPRPPLWIGGSSRPALRRAAQVGDGIIVSGFSSEMNAAYREELRATGRSEAEGRVASNLRWFMVADDPERTFCVVAPYVMNWYNHYAQWMDHVGGPFRHVSSEQELRSRNLLTVLRPVEAVAALKEHAAIAPLSYLNIKARPPGCPAEIAASHLELFSKYVMPALL